jgi:hypothetical protein
MLCKAHSTQEESKPSSSSHVQTGSHLSSRTFLALYPIQQAKVSGTGKKVTVFCDNGSNTTYITHKAADRIKAKRLSKYTLDITTMGNVETTYDTVEYEFTLQTVTGKKVDVKAYGMNKITGPVSKLDLNTVSELFPDYDVEVLQRQNTEVDVLLGCDYFGLHPKKEEERCGDHLYVMSGELGICLQGTHPRLKEETELDTNFVKTFHDSNLAKTIHDTKLRADVNFIRLDVHPEVHLQPQTTSPTTDKVHQTDCNLTTRPPYCKKTEVKVDGFIQGEELGTEVNPRCGGCRCSKCPTVGHTYSFKEEQELKMIRENLVYDEIN